MKKFFALFLTACMICTFTIGLTGCGDGKKADTKKDEKKADTKKDEKKEEKKDEKK